MKRKDITLIYRIVEMARAYTMSERLRHVVRARIRERGVEMSGKRRPGPTVSPPEC